MRIGPQQLRAMHELIASPLQFTQPMSASAFRAALRREQMRASMRRQVKAVRLAERLALDRQKRSRAPTDLEHRNAQDREFLEQVLRGQPSISAAARAAEVSRRRIQHIAARCGFELRQRLQSLAA